MSESYNAALADYCRAKEHFDNLVDALKRAETACQQATLAEDRLRREVEKVGTEHRLNLIMRGLNPTSALPLSAIAARDELTTAAALTKDLWAAFDKLSLEAGRAQANMDAAQRILNKETAKRIAGEGLDLIQGIEALLRQIEPLHRQLLDFAAAFQSDLGGGDRPYALPYHAMRQVTETLAKLPPLPPLHPTAEAAARDAWRAKYLALAGVNPPPAAQATAA
jgi:hypothetical protein